MTKPDPETKHLQRISIRNIDRIKKFGNIGYADSLNCALDRVLDEYTEMKKKQKNTN